VEDDSNVTNARPYANLNEKENDSLKPSFQTFKSNIAPCSEPLIQHCFQCRCTQAEKGHKTLLKISSESIRQCC